VRFYRVNNLDKLDDDIKCMVWIDLSKESMPGPRVDGIPLMKLISFDYVKSCRWITW